MKIRLAALMTVMLLALGAGSGSALAADPEATSEPTWTLTAEVTRIIGLDSRGREHGIIRASLGGTQDGLPLSDAQVLIRFSPASGGSARDAALTTDEEGLAQTEEFFATADDYRIAAWVDGQRVATTQVRLAKYTPSPTAQPPTPAEPTPSMTSSPAAKPSKTPGPELSEPAPAAKAASAAQGPAEDQAAPVAEVAAPAVDDSPTPTPTPSSEDAVTPPLPVECQIEGCEVPDFDTGGGVDRSILGWALALALAATAGTVGLAVGRRP
jgi:hypothetical protein